MAMTKLSAKYQEKDENGNATLDAEGKPIWTEIEGEYDFGENLQEAIDKFGAEVVFSQYLANAKVKIQGIMRDRKKAGQTDGQISEFLTTYVLGEVIERAQVNPMEAVKSAFAQWDDEKKKAFLAELGIAVD